MAVAGNKVGVLGSGVPAFAVSPAVDRPMPAIPRATPACAGTESGPQPEIKTVKTRTSKQVRIHVNRTRVLPSDLLPADISSIAMTGPTGALHIRQRYGGIHAGRVARWQFGATSGATGRQCRSIPRIGPERLIGVAPRHNDSSCPVDEAVAAQLELAAAVQARPDSWHTAKAAAVSKAAACRR